MDASALTNFPEVPNFRKVLLLIILFESVRKLKSTLTSEPKKIDYSIGWDKIVYQNHPS